MCSGSRRARGERGDRNIARGKIVTCFVTWTNVPQTGEHAMNLPSPQERRASRLLLALSALLPLIQLGALAVSPANYNYFIDEFYYIACSKHLALGYVDHPPLAPWLLAGTRLFLGDSLFGIRLLPFLAGGATVWLTGRLVRELGGGRFAVVLATLAFALSPILVAMTGFFSMNAFEPLLWSALMLTLVRLVKTGNSRLWLLAGTLGGIAFENKHTIVAYLAALGAGIVSAAVVARLERGRFGEAGRFPFSVRDPWMWAGGGIAVALALPNVAWQAMNGWPSLEFSRNATALKNIPVPPLQSLLAQVLSLNPVTFPIWAAGLTFLLFARDARSVRFAGTTYLVLLAVQVASGSSRPDRIVAAYPVLMAAGGVVLERLVRRPFPRVAATAVVAATGAMLSFMFLPVLRPADEARYVAFLHADVKIERGKTSPLPQLMADRTGWRSFVDDVERVYRSLPPADQARAIIFVPDYGHAGAIDLWGPAAGLPRVISNHNTYWHWSDGRTSAPVLIAVGADPAGLQRLYRDVRPAGTVQCEYCMSWRSNMPISVAKDPIVPLDGVWARLRHYE